MIILFALIRNEQVPLWREVASILVPSAILNILYFMFLGTPHFAISYPLFLATILFGQAICMIIYHCISFIELHWLSFRGGKVVFVLVGIIIIAGNLIAPTFAMLLPAFAVLVLVMFHVFYVRLSLSRSWYEVYRRTLLPQIVFLILYVGFFLNIVNVEVPRTTATLPALFYSSSAYFFVRPFINHIIRVRAPGTPEA
ncbi:MAG: hypothetical protein M1551_00605 [Firmicutes bacterium]|nr:hypothetical protein [Bacillota bacterium]